MRFRGMDIRRAGRPPRTKAKISGFPLRDPAEASARGGYELGRTPLRYTGLDGGRRVSIPRCAYRWADW